LLENGGMGSVRLYNNEEEEGLYENQLRNNNCLVHFIEILKLDLLFTDVATLLPYEGFYGELIIQGIQRIVLFIACSNLFQI